MDTADRFLRFAAECEVMAKFTHSRQNKAIWNGLAQRWLRCAELIDREHGQVRHGGPARRQRLLSHSLPH